MYGNVNQDIGKCFLKDEIKGYYNNMTEKVTKVPELLNSDELRNLILKEASLHSFLSQFFQYGLGAYDLYLQTH